MAICQLITLIAIVDHETGTRRYFCWVIYGLVFLYFSAKYHVGTQYSR
jgi:hypothetical protein